MTTRKRKQPETVWEQPWAYAWFTRPLGFLAFVYLAHLALWNADVPVVWVAGVGAAVALGSPLLFPDFPLRDRWFYFLVTASMAGHLVWGRLTVPWGRDQLTVAVAGAVLFGLWWHVLNVTRASAKGKQHDQQKAAETDVERGRYVDMIERALKRKPGTSGLKEKRREPFPAGTRVVFDIRHLAVSTAMLYDLGDALDTAADARPGTYVFERGATAGEAIMNVFERDVLAEEIPYPFATGPKSIHQPMPLGQYATGEVCVITFRELAALLVGIKGRGKSALLNTHLAYLTGCTDAVVWMMDGKGGRTARPWLLPFLEAVKQRGFSDETEALAALDWVAISEPEFDAMLLGVNAAIRHRSRGAGDKVVPSRATPSIILIVEEASVITGTGNYGNVKRADLAKTAVVQGRSEAVDAIFASQRATVTMLGGGDMKSNLDLRYGLGVVDPYDARDIFTDGKLAQSLFALGDDKRYRGVFLMQAPGSRRVMPAKGYWIHPDAVPGIAKRNAEYRPPLDRGTADAVHAYLEQMGVPGGYYGRWGRLLQELGVEHVAAEQAVEHGNRSTETQPESYGARMVREAVERSRAERAQKRADQEKQRFDEIVSGAGWDAETESWDSSGTVRDVPGNAPPVLRLMAQAFIARDAEQLPTKLLIADLGGTLTPHTLGRLMGHCGVSPVQNLIWNGKSVRGYRWEDVETSLKRNSWPPQAFDWQP
jgi:hypothetical protein